MNAAESDDDFGVPDDENPEWTEETFRWAVHNKDFGGFEGALTFLRAREEFLRDAKSVGLERNAFLPFEPTKPGFVERAQAALEQLISLRSHAAE
jgi:hypothetical protein